MYVYVYVYMYVCVYVCTCMYVRTYIQKLPQKEPDIAFCTAELGINKPIVDSNVCMYVCMYVCIRMYVCVCVCTYACPTRSMYAICMFYKVCHSFLRIYQNRCTTFCSTDDNYAKNKLQNKCLRSYLPIYISKR